MNVFNKLAIGHCNMQGGLTGLAKSLEIQNLIRHEKLDILALNETNLKPEIATDTLNLPQNYKFIRKDRSNGSGRGGCGILISENIKFKEIRLKLTTNTNNIESFWIHLVKIKKGEIPSYADPVRPGPIKSTHR